ncbi:omega-hydroxypalmitate O-feruloyl transferase-like [Coffea eugenioides]|nr:omega-hydroxypalmitate O-feruloyl transferase-like [Coffea eugenioides]XP_027156441.1 omega-hydroxypalmitate O-feruloyl transferase-like [Coffea eugenioides]
MPLSVLPHLDRSILSPRLPPIVNITHDEYIKQEKKRLAFPPSLNGKVMHKSFCFYKNTLCRLRLLAMEVKDISTTPTNFELISALLWINWTKAFKIKPEATTRILTAVDGRPKSKPPLPNCYFGNGIAWSCAHSKAGELAQKPFSFAVKFVHDATKAVTEDYIKSAIDHYEVARQQLEFQDTFWISKWSRLPFNEIKFGWGDPQEVAPASLVDNLVVCVSQGKDIENIVVSLSLPSVVMERFEGFMKEELE